MTDAERVALLYAADPAFRASLHDAEHAHREGRTETLHEVMERLGITDNPEPGRQS